MVKNQLKENQLKENQLKQNQKRKKQEDVEDNSLYLTKKNIKQYI